MEEGVVRTNSLWEPLVQRPTFERGGWVWGLTPLCSCVRPLQTPQLSSQISILQISTVWPWASPFPSPASVPPGRQGIKANSLPWFQFSSPAPPTSFPTLLIPSLVPVMLTLALNAQADFYLMTLACPGLPAQDHHPLLPRFFLGSQLLSACGLYPTFSLLHCVHLLSPAP